MSVGVDIDKIKKLLEKVFKDGTVRLLLLVIVTVTWGSQYVDIKIISDLVNVTIVTGITIVLIFVWLEAIKQIVLMCQDIWLSAKEKAKIRRLTPQKFFKETALELGKQFVEKSKEEPISLNILKKKDKKENKEE